jgi:hypothetical protein
MYYSYIVIEAYFSVYEAKAMCTSNTWSLEAMWV